MPRRKESRARRTRAFAFLDTTLRLYHNAFGRLDEGHNEEVAANWDGLFDSERSFVATHLLYLSVRGQGQILKSIVGLTRRVDDLIDVMEDVARGLESDSEEASETVVDVPDDEPDPPASPPAAAQLAVPELVELPGAPASPQGSAVTGPGANLHLLPAWAGA